MWYKDRHITPEFRADFDTINRNVTITGAISSMEEAMHIVEDTAVLENSSHLGE